jgi:hypothetical protein
MPPIHSTDHLVFERLQELQREGEQRRRLARSRKAHPSRLHHLIGRLGTFFVALGTKLQQVEQPGEPAV